jgi:hypothetical protein
MQIKDINDCYDMVRISGHSQKQLWAQTRYSFIVTDSKRLLRTIVTNDFIVQYA